MEYSYPILKKVAAYYQTTPHDVHNVYLVCCQHILEPQRHMFGELIAFGFDPAKILVLGKTYSTSQEVLEELKTLGIHAIQPPFEGAPFDQEHEHNCRMLIESIPHAAKCILLDDGAQLIQMAISAGKNVWFGVEQTSSGFRKLEHVSVPFPVLNVARSSTKLVQESPFVARHAGERMRGYFQKEGVQDPSILIVGLGPIGEAVKDYFEQGQYRVEGFDIRHGHHDLMNRVLELRPDVIIGATGSPILSAEEVEELPSDKPLHLISMSSSDREFPVAAFRKDLTATHIDIPYRNITFVNNGFPISFMGNRYESLPVEMEKTMCLLGGAVMYGATNPELSNGLLDLPEHLEELINS